MLQSTACREGPSQLFPPLLGGGAPQRLVLCFEPPPQVLEHCPKTLQGDQLPSTRKKISLHLFTFVTLD